MFSQTKPAALAALVLLAACGRRLEEAPLAVGTIGGQQLTLDNAGGACQLSSATGPVDLGIPWPCGFHRTPNGAVRTVQRGQAEIALVESSQPHPELAKTCKTEIRGLAVTGGEVYVSEQKETVAHCPPFQWDEQMFKTLFSDR